MGGVGILAYISIGAGWFCGLVWPLLGLNNRDFLQIDFSDHGCQSEVSATHSLHHITH